MALLYGRQYEKFETVRNTFEKNLKISLNSDGLYARIKSIGKLKESIGIYYQGEEQSNPDDEPTDSNVPDANKTEKRVITYTKP